MQLDRGLCTPVFSFTFSAVRRGISEVSVVWSSSDFQGVQQGRLWCTHHVVSR